MLSVVRGILVLLSLPQAFLLFLLRPSKQHDAVVLRFRALNVELRVRGDSTPDDLKVVKSVSLFRRARRSDEMRDTSLMSLAFCFLVFCLALEAAGTAVYSRPLLLSLKFGVRWVLGALATDPVSALGWATFVCIISILF